MKKIVFALLLAVCAAGARGQEIKSENLQDFNRITLSGNLNVVLEKSDRNRIEATLHNTEMKKISLSVKDKKLTVRLKHNTRDKGYADIKIYYTSLSGIELIFGEASFANTVEAGIFTVDVSNGGKLSAKFETKDLTVSSDGGSMAALTGRTDYLTVNSDSGSRIDARDLEARSVTARCRYGAEMFVWGTDKLDASAGTGSTIYYKGDPEVLKVAEKMMGSVEQFSF